MTPRLTPDGDAENLRSVVRGFLERHTEPDPDPDAGWDDTTWRRFATELGAVALDVPDELGGAGATFREVGVVAGELGRRPARLPWFSTAVLGVGVLLHTTGTDDVRHDLLQRLVDGRTTATLAHTDRAGRGSTYATGDDATGWRLGGAKTLVVEGATAGVLFVTAGTATGPRLFAVDGDAAGLVRTPLRAMDPTRQLADVVLDGTPGTPLGAPGDAPGVVGRVLARARAALACEQTGGAGAAMDQAVDHAARRLQFGRPIATFQAVKHRCADMAVRVEAARSASLWAAAAVAEDTDVDTATTLAALVCADAHRWVAAENVQVHGGIGFTWEHTAHLQVRRAATSAVLLGEPDHDTLLATIGV
ncbi:MULTISPECIES: acyl-CoA dehydrogenase family protein [unclassified Pseudonocardia]|uniref:acyl-CoA dehydrogenase family protein n=1 Tax=unclassified Pseudonocardia TaxID=2619320 RepID=UPI0001FFDA9D|nr:acyl-CoA dehydrogenase family protein [Pseudonocardia sp. Ae707_Ps1]OLM20287.1 Butyryl-CoA dehydrogenase [Pseudonocardia sp. Ae707_Ps1]